MDWYNQKKTLIALRRDDAYRDAADVDADDHENNDDNYAVSVIIRMIVMMITIRAMTVVTEL